MPIITLPVNPRVHPRQRWHRRFVIVPRRVRIEHQTGTKIVWLCTLQRRWSDHRQAWLWAMPGTFTLGTRQK